MVLEEDFFCNEMQKSATQLSCTVTIPFCTAAATKPKASTTKLPVIQNSSVFSQDPSSLVVRVTLSAPFITSQETEKCNFLRVLPLEMINIMEDFRENDSENNVSYALNLQVPISATSERTIVIPGGALIRNQNEYSIVWKETEMYYFLPPQALSIIRERIVGRNMFICEVRRVTSTKSLFHQGNSPGAKFKALINLSQLMIPDSTEIQETYNVHHTIEESAMNRRKASAALFGRLKLKIALQKPLMCIRKLDIDRVSVFDYIKRKKLPKNCYQEHRMKEARNRFRVVIKEMINTIECEYSLSKSDLQSFKEQLNARGMMQKLKETMKPVVLQITKEMYRDHFKDSCESFFANSYSEVAFQLNQMIIEHLQPHPKEELEDKVLLRAKEFEREMNYSCALELYAKNAARQKNVSSLFLLGVALSKSGEKSKAQECFKEILSENGAHFSSLIAFGIICDEEKVAEASLQEAHNLDAKNSTLYLLFAHYKVWENQKAQIVKENIQVIEATKEDWFEAKVEAARLCVELGAQKHAEELFCDNLHLGVFREMLILRAKLYMQTNLDISAQQMNEAIQNKMDDGEAWALLARIHYIQKDYQKAKQEYETALLYDEKNVEVFGDLAMCCFYLGLKDLNNHLLGGNEELLKKAQKYFLRSKKWSWAALVSIYLNEMEEAESGVSVCVN